MENEHMWGFPLGFFGLSGKHLPPPGVPLHAHWNNIAKWAVNIDKLLFLLNVKAYSSDIVR